MAVGIDVGDQDVFLVAFRRAGGELLRLRQQPGGQIAVSPADVEHLVAQYCPGGVDFQGLGERSAGEVQLGGCKQDRAERFPRA